MALESAKLSDFRLEGALGTGATAMVYGAFHLETGRPVAIKLMADASPDHERRERFAREALLLAEVRSRHVGKILGFGFDKGQPFLVLERLRGETLDEKLRRDGPIPAASAYPWIEQLIMGVRDCHAAKIIHRDIKPSNLFIHRDEDGEAAKVIDFGVARLREVSGQEEGLTSASHMLGSMGYMAPEQFANAQSAGFSADLYAIGVVVFRTLTGRLPFVSRSLETVIRMKTEQGVPLVSSIPGMPKNELLDWFVHTAMVRDPGARFQSAREMLEQWANVVADHEERLQRARPRSAPVEAMPAEETSAPDSDVTQDFARDELPLFERRPGPPRTPIPLPSQLADLARESSPGPTEGWAIEAIEGEEGEQTRRSPMMTGAPSSMPGLFRDRDTDLEETAISSGAAGASRRRHEALEQTVVGTARPSGSAALRAGARGENQGEFDVGEDPTVPNESLERLVERELALHRARLRGRE